MKAQAQIGGEYQNESMDFKEMDINAMNCIDLAKGRD